MKKIFFMLGTVLLSCALQAQTAVNIYQDCSQNGDTIDLRATGLQVIDMGLSVKWANMNIGATAPEEVGSYFAWGETMPKDSYSLDNYVWWKDDGYACYKYDNIDKRVTLEPQDDAAYMTWGGTWRMPTNAEWQELKDNSTWFLTSYNGVDGYLITSTINGNQLFFPATSRYVDDNELVDYELYYGYYWSSTHVPGEGVGDSTSRMILFSVNQFILGGGGRDEGFAVRAVCP